MTDKKVIPIGGGSGGGESVIVDSELNASSTNPVQNKAITNALNNKANKVTTLAGYGIGDAYTKAEVDSLVGKNLGMKAVGSERSRASNKPNYGL